jgi:DNA polymerase-3 subunit chi
MATTVQFYHLLHTPLEVALPSLLQKVLAAGHRMTLHSADAAQLRHISDAIWRRDGQTFIPHGSSADGYSAMQPIFLTSSFENPNDAGVLVIIDGSPAPMPTSYSKILDLFDGRDEEAVARARSRWAGYKTQGFALQYIRQQAGGGWKTEAEAAAAA